MKITRKAYYTINFILLFTVLFLSFGVATWLMYRDQKSTAKEKTRILTEQVRDDLNETLEQVEVVSRSMFLNEDFQDLVDDIYSDVSIQQISAHFNLFMQMSNLYKNAIYIPRDVNGEIDIENTVSYFSMNYELQYNLTQIVALADLTENQSGKNFFTKIYYFDGTITPYYAVARNVYDVRPESYLKKMGIGIVFFSAGNLVDMVNDYCLTLDGLQFGVFDETSCVFASNQFPTEYEKRGGYSQTVAPLDRFSWRIVGVFDDSMVWYNMKENFVILVVVMSVAGLSCIFLAVFVNKKSSKSLDYLFNSFSNFSNNKVVEVIPPSDDAEVNQVIDRFNGLVHSFKNLNDEMLKQKNRELKLELRNAEYMLDSLHSQINKHFLINILSMVRAHINSGEAEKAKETVEELSEFLRMVLTTDGKSTVKQELDMIRSYLKIQVLRYPRIKVEIECDEEYADVMIPKMILQPVIENAFVHGLQNKVGEIRVVCRMKKEFVLFFIIDNGQGVDADRVREINRCLKEGKKLEVSSGNGIALNNIEQRLKLFSGKKSVIRMFSKKGHGTIVMLKIHKGE